MAWHGVGNGMAPGRMGHGMGPGRAPTPFLSISACASSGFWRTMRDMAETAVARRLSLQLLLKISCSAKSTSGDEKRPA